MENVCKGGIAVVGTATKTKGPENKMSNIPSDCPSCYGNATHYYVCSMSRSSNCPFIESCQVQVAQKFKQPPCFGDRATLLDDSECARKFCDAVEDCTEKVFKQWANQLLGVEND